MKKLLCIILTLTILVSIFSTSATAIVAPEDSAPINQKEIIKQRLVELYGEEGILEDGVNYTWDYTLADDALENGDVSPLWGSGGVNKAGYSVHGQIITKANELSGELIPTKYLSLVKSMNKLCDTIRKWSSSNKENYISGHLHGEGNYFSNLDYLWTFTQQLMIYTKNVGEENLTRDSLVDCIHKANRDAKNKVPTDELNSDSFSKFTGFIGLILQKYYYPTAADLNKDTIIDDNLILRSAVEVKSGQKIRGRCKHILYGLIAHQIGDTFAHRVIVPNGTAKNIPFHVENDDGILIPYTHPNIPDDSAKHFVYSVFEPFDYEEEMAKIITIGLNNDGEQSNICFSELKNYTFPETSDEYENAVSTLNSDYVDNAEFYPLRVDEAVEAYSFFLVIYESGFDIETLRPVNGFSLKKYDAYLRKINSL